VIHSSGLRLDLAQPRGIVTLRSRLPPWAGTAYRSANSRQRMQTVRSAGSNLPGAIALIGAPHNACRSPTTRAC